MEQLKVEMVKRSHEIGDTGSGAIHRKWVEMFLTQAQRWLTPAAIETFTADELRGPYVAFVTHYLSSQDVSSAGDAIPHYIRCQTVYREGAAPRTPTDPKVVSIFGKS